MLNYEKNQFGRLSKTISSEVPEVSKIILILTIESLLR